MIPTVSLKPRNRLAETILAALHDSHAREELETLAKAPDGETPAGWLSYDDRRHADALIARARCAADALGGIALGRAAATLAEALAHAAVLFDAGLYFEVHELLEPYWRDLRGPAREALQGLIQIAVGYQHFANGNLGGAQALLEEGAERLERAAPIDGELGRLDLRRFASDVLVSRERLPDLEDDDVPHFPTASTVT